MLDHQLVDEFVEFLALFFEGVVVTFGSHHHFLVVIGFYTCLYLAYFKQ